MTSPAEPWSQRPDGLAVSVRVIPRSSKNDLGGTDMDESGRAFLKVRLTAAPTDGKANAALCLFLAELFGIPKSAVVVVQGHKARLKRLLISGDGATLLARARALTSPAPK